MFQNKKVIMSQSFGKTLQMMQMGRHIHFRYGPKA